jgi:hypothetical protein
MGTRVRALLGTVLVVAVPAVTIRLLHGLADRPWFEIDYDDLGGWLARTDLVDALTALARLTALALAYYLLISTALYLIALATGSRGLIRLARPFAIPMVRTLADRIVAGSIAVSTIAAPLIATAPPAPDAAAVAGVSAEVSVDYVPPSRLVEDVPLDRTAPAPPDEQVAFTGRPTTAPQQPTVEETSPEPISGPMEVIAVKGDHLWGLAEARMAKAMGRDPLEHELAPYWRDVVDENRSRIRSGNPDLIFPGEVIVLPDPEPHLSRP